MSTKRTAALSLASQLHSQERAFQSTLDFHSQVSSLSRSFLQMHFWLSLRVTSPLKNVLANALVTFTRKSLHCCLCPIRESLPLWHGFLLWCSHPALASLILPSGATHLSAQDTHCGLGFALWCSISSDTATHPIGHVLYSFLSYLWRKFRLTESVLATRCHLIKMNLILFPLTVLRHSVF